MATVFLEAPAYLQFHGIRYDTLRQIKNVDFRAYLDRCEVEVDGLDKKEAKTKAWELAYGFLDAKGIEEYSLWLPTKLAGWAISQLYR